MANSSNPFPVVSSLLSPLALQNEVEQTYKLGLSGCNLLRSYVNDVYKLSTAQTDQLYILKIYRANWRSYSEIAYELEVLSHLEARSVAVAMPVKRLDGGLIGTLNAPEGVRYYVVFNYAEGAKPTPPFTPALYTRFGYAAAHLHTALDNFTSQQSRVPLDLTYLLDQPLQAIAPLLAHRPDDWIFLNRMAEAVRRRITKLIKDGLNWGICHGDMTLDNLHITADQRFVFYDFDFCGPGWRAYDPNGIFQYQHNESNGVWDAFLSAYREVRPFSAMDEAAVPYMVAANGIWSIAYNVTMLAANRGTWVIGNAYFDRELVTWRKWAGHYFDLR